MPTPRPLDRVVVRAPLRKTMSVPKRGPRLAPPPRAAVPLLSLLFVLLVSVAGFVYWYSTRAVREAPVPSSPQRLLQTAPETLDAGRGRGRGRGAGPGVDSPELDARVVAEAACIHARGGAAEPRRCADGRGGVAAGSGAATGCSRGPTGGGRESGDDRGRGVGQPGWPCRQAVVEPPAPRPGRRLGAEATRGGDHVRAFPGRRSRLSHQRPLRLRRCWRGRPRPRRRFARESRPRP